MEDGEKMLFLVEGLKPALCSFVMDKKPNMLQLALCFAREKENSLKLAMLETKKDVPVPIPPVANVNPMQEICQLFQELKQDLQQQWQDLT